MKWGFFACLAGFGGFVGVVVFSIVGPQPKPKEGWDRPIWLPTTAADVHYRSREGFGWWRAAEFTIRESELRAYTIERGWKLQERLDYRPTWTITLLPTRMASSTEAGRDGEDPKGSTDPLSIPRALVFENVQANGGGIHLAFDPATSRAYYGESHR